MLEPDQQKRKQILFCFYTVAYEPILRHWSLCKPTENILSSHFFVFSWVQKETNDMKCVQGLKKAAVRRCSS